MSKSWTTSPPTICDICHKPIKNIFIDGTTKIHRQWALMCLDCHTKVGIGLGLGKGQMYEKIDEKWIKDWRIKDWRIKCNLTKSKPEHK